MHSGLNDYKILGEIGRGSYGVVYKAETASRGICAIKTIKIKHLSPRRQEQAMKEAQLLKELNHPNLISCLGSFIQKGHLHIVMEFAEGGDLQALINQCKKSQSRISEDRIWRIAQDVVCGLNYLHAKQIMHRDLKCMNVLLTADGTAKLGDLGASTVVHSPLRASELGTPLYLSPEQVKKVPYDLRTDIWALGCILYALASLSVPFKGSNMMALNVSIVSMSPKPIPAMYSKRLGFLIERCLDKRVEKRISLRKIGELLERGEINDQVPTTQVEEDDRDYFKIPVLNINWADQPQFMTGEKKGVRRKLTEITVPIEATKDKEEIGSRIQNDIRRSSVVSARSGASNLLYLPRGLTRIQRSKNYAEIQVATRRRSNERRVSITQLV